MPATLTYRPLTPQNSAKLLRTNTCRFARFAEPRCPHTYGVRVCSCISIATEPCRPTVCISVTQSPSDHCSLITVHWSYTFSAKEKDSETGLSYFGSRYYSSDLSVWLSVDPQAGKYPSTSPYAYCRNNPIILMDPNGEFDTRAEARQYRKEHHTGGIIKKNSETNQFAGNYSINNKRKQDSYTKPQYEGNDALIPMIGRSSDGVVKSAIARDPRTRREKIDDFERTATQKGVAVGQGLATALPITSQVNDIMILSKGETMFGDKATKSDEVLAKIDLAIFGVGIPFTLFEEACGPVLKKAADYVEDVGNGLSIRSWFVTTKNKWKNGKKKK